MRLIGMLDSPYVRRVAISLQLLGIRFEHEPLSVFRTFDQFRAINPVVKAPSLVCEDGEVLMDSTLILEYLEDLPAKRRSLMSPTSAERRSELQIIGLALAACEKAVQVVYEQNLRPAEKLHEPWVQRVTGQLLASFGEMELRLARSPLPVTSTTIGQAGITAAVAWHFTRTMFPEMLSSSAHPALDRFSTQAESLAEFQAAPHGAGTYVPQ